MTRLLPAVHCELFYNYFHELFIIFVFILVFEKFSLKKMSQSKQRSANFSKSEEEKLVALVLEKKNIFENKKTDAVTSKQKDTAWEKLAQQFNASSETNTVSIFNDFTIFTSKYILVFFIFDSIDSYSEGVERKVQ